MTYPISNSSWRSHVSNHINRYTIALSLLVLFMVSFGKFISYLHWDFDDSFIIYRIVNNILQGNGWVYNINENHNPSTSVLNTVLVTLLSYGIGNIRLAAHIIGLLSILWAGIFVYILFYKRFGNSFALLTGFIAVIQLADNLTWGLETNLFICLILAFVLLEEHHKNSWPLLGILVLTRPDGVLMVGLKWAKEFFSRRSYSLKGVLIVSVILAPWVIFSLYQFNQFFPDTFSQKVWQGNSGFWGSGLIYLKFLGRRYVLNSSLLTKGLIAIGGIGIILMLLERSQFLYIFLFGIIQQTAYMIFNVPDYHWYLALPNILIHIAAFYTIGTVCNGIKRQFSARLLSNNSKFFGIPLQVVEKGLLLLVPLIIGTAFFIFKKGYDDPPFDLRVLSYTRIVRSFDKLYGPGRLAAVEVGTIGFYTDRTIVDITGLTSSQGQFLTRDRMDYFYKDPPELLLLHNPIWGMEGNIFNDYRFPIVYDLGMHLDDQNHPMKLYVRKDHVNLENIASYLTDYYPYFQRDDFFDDLVLTPLFDGKFFLDSINGYPASKKQLVIQKKVPLVLDGWAVDIRRRQAPPNVFVVLENKNKERYSLQCERRERKDVAHTLGDPVYHKSGFHCAGLTSGLPPGTYSMRLIQEVEDGKYCYAELNNQIQIP